MPPTRVNNTRRRWRPWSDETAVAPRREECSVVAEVEAPSQSLSCLSRLSMCFWTLGVMNNYPYVIIASAVEQMVKDFSIPRNYGPLITWAQVSLGFLVRIVNAFLLPRQFPYFLRFCVFAVLTLLGLATLTAATYMPARSHRHAADPGNKSSLSLEVPSFHSATWQPNQSPIDFADNITTHTPTCPHARSPAYAAFAVSLVGAVLSGSASSFGESVALGYMERFPAGLVGMWSSGTGLSGVAGSAVFLLLSAAAGLDLSYIFILTGLAVLCYMIAVVALPKPAPRESAPAPCHGPPPEEPDDCKVSIGTLPTQVEPEPEIQDDERTALLGHRGLDTSPADGLPYGNKPPSFSFRRLCKVQRQVLYNTINLMLVYAFEYACQSCALYATSCADVLSVPHESTSKAMYRVLHNNFYSASQFAYQAGVLISRSSLSFVKIKQVWILSLLQLGNVIFWMVQGSLKPLDATSADVFLLLLLMFFVGLLGGASYVNVFYNLLNDQSIDADDRELAMNIGAIYINFGIIVGTLFPTLYGNCCVTKCLDVCGASV